LHVEIAKPGMAQGC